MDIPSKPARAVVVAQADVAEALQRIFSEPPFEAWNCTLAESVERAIFLSQAGVCDVLVIDAVGIDLSADLPLLTARGTTPVLLLSELDGDIVEQALTETVHLWLPRRLVLERPLVLARALEHACRSLAHDDGDVDRRVRLERLADLLWNCLPFDGRSGWLTQRYLLERLHEEVVRALRHETPLSIIVAELDAGDGDVQSAFAERVLKSKRRSDVVGQYGTTGFLLLLPHTSEAGAEHVRRRLRRDLAEASGRLHATFGVASISSSIRSPKGLLRSAEERLAEDVD